MSRLCATRILCALTLSQNIATVPPTLGGVLFSIAQVADKRKTGSGLSGRTQPR